jgi:hypothetical protein
MEILACMVCNVKFSVRMSALRMSALRMSAPIVFNPAAETGRGVCRGLLLAHIRVEAKRMASRRLAGSRPSPPRVHRGLLLAHIRVEAKRMASRRLRNAALGLWEVHSDTTGTRIKLNGNGLWYWTKSNKPQAETYCNWTLFLQLEQEEIRALAAELEQEELESCTEEFEC